VSPDDRTDDASARLRAQGLRVTPQRRAILAAFTGTATEHLSADEVHARAAAAVPEIGRGTVYAALAELTELGLLAAVGNPEPVRYETNVDAHQHFRCRACLRLYDVALDAPPAAALKRRGFLVEHTTVIAEGICADCAAYDRGLSDGAARSDGVRAAAGAAVALPRGTAYGVADTPIGRVQMLCTERGALRVMYADHAEGPAVAAAGARRRGGREAQRRLAELDTAIDGYFAHGTPFAQELAIDWDAAATDPDDGATLDAVRAIPFAGGRSYEQLGLGDAPFHRGVSIGSNPLALVVPCHRVSRGREITTWYVGGPERKRALLDHERRHAER
jgi:Fur family transcriptional regulator, stress-responsive regulator